MFFWLPISPCCQFHRKKNSPQVDCTPHFHFLISHTFLHSPWLTYLHLSIKMVLVRVYKHFMLPNPAKGPQFLQFLISQFTKSSFFSFPLFRFFCYLLILISLFWLYLFLYLNLLLNVGTTQGSLWQSILPLLPPRWSYSLDLQTSICWWCPNL